MGTLIIKNIFLKIFSNVTLLLSENDDMIDRTFMTMTIIILIMDNDNYRNLSMIFDRITLFSLLGDISYLFSFEKVQNSNHSILLNVYWLKSILHFWAP